MRGEQGRAPVVGALPTWSAPGWSPDSPWERCWPSAGVGPACLGTLTATRPWAWSVTGSASSSSSRAGFWKESGSRHGHRAGPGGLGAPHSPALQVPPPTPSLLDRAAHTMQRAADERGGKGHAAVNGHGLFCRTALNQGVWGMTRSAHLKHLRRAPAHVRSIPADARARPFLQTPERWPPPLPRTRPQPLLPVQTWAVLASAHPSPAWAARPSASATRTLHPTAPAVGPPSPPLANTKREEELLVAEATCGPGGH